MAKITLENDDRDAWICRCGNTPCGDGFYPCDKRGAEMDPVRGWGGLYVCNKCGAVIDQSSLEIVGEVKYKVSGKIDADTGEATITRTERVVTGVR